MVVFNARGLFDRSGLGTPKDPRPASTRAATMDTSTGDGA